MAKNFLSLKSSIFQKFLLLSKFQLFGNPKKYRNGNFYQKNLCINLFSQQTYFNSIKIKLVSNKKIVYFQKFMKPKFSKQTSFLLHVFRLNLQKPKKC